MVTSGNCSLKAIRQFVTTCLCSCKTLVGIIHWWWSLYVDMFMRHTQLQMLNTSAPQPFIFPMRIGRGVSRASGTSGVIVSGTPFYSGDDGGAISLVGIFRRGNNGGAVAIWFWFLTGSLWIRLNNKTSDPQNDSCLCGTAFWKAKRLPLAIKLAVRVQTTRRNTHRYI